MSHTPGPWRIEGERLKTAISGGHKHVAMVNYFDCGRGDPRSISKEEHEANARLIAAAPDLLEACEAALACMRTQENIDETYQQLTSAIRLAKE